MHTPDQTHKERLYLDINLQLMQKNLPEIKWLIVLLEKEERFEVTFRDGSQLKDEGVRQILVDKIGRAHV